MVALSVSDLERSVMLAALGVSGVGLSLADLRYAYYLAGGGGGGGGGTWGSITGSLASQLDLSGALAAKAPSASPTFTGTVSGITQDMVPDGATNKAYSNTDKTKLAGIASGATINSPDATLLNRANHTGTQAPATVTGTAVVTADSRLSDQRVPTVGSVDNSKVAVGAAILATKIAGEAVTVAGGTTDIAPVGLSGSAADLTGILGIEQAPAGVIIGILYNTGGAAYPANPTSRTDVYFDYIDPTGAHTPTNARNNDLWDHA